MLTFGHLHDVVAGALQGHFAEDDTMATANERARVARILVHVDRHVSDCEICHGLSVDSEYSRIGAGLTNKELREQRVFPDLLLHRRTVQTGNLLAVEVKLRESSRPQAGPDTEDLMKINAMTGLIGGLPDEMEPYSAGLCLNLDGNSGEGWWVVPKAELWCTYEKFSGERPPALVDGFGVVVWDTRM